jgi:hypothetical protein
MCSLPKVMYAINSGRASVGGGEQVAEHVPATELL